MIMFLISLSKCSSYEPDAPVKTKALYLIYLFLTTFNHFVIATKVKPTLF